MARVIVVGSLNVDHPWRVPRHPVVGETVEGRSLRPVPGGKGLNQAVAARRMGAEVALLGCVGRDDDGRWLIEVARNEGIASGGIQIAGDAPTGSALIVVDEAGANTVTVSPGANRSLELGTLLVERRDVVVAQLEVSADAVASAFDQARRAGARTILNPSPVGLARDLLSLADVVVVNETELAELAGATAATTAENPAGVARSIARDGQRVVVTLGAGGVLACSPDGVHREPGIPADAIDTTGAGDCFLGVLAASLVEGLLLAHAVGRANRAAAIAVTRPGTVDAMPRRVEVDG
jgi:ribokinase